jgi:hypothetical protein
MPDYPSIRVDTGIKRVQINDGPDFIEFNPSDVTFAERFYQVMQEFEVKKEEYLIRANEVDANKKIGPDGITTNLPEEIAIIRDICEFMRSEIDVLFGTGTSQKVFGSALAVGMFEQFFNGILPFIKVARSNKTAKYMPKTPNKKRRARRIVK